MIVLNENEWAKDIINMRTLGKKPYDTFRRIARYYMDNGYSKKQTRDLLDKYLLQCDPSASLPKWSELIDSAVSRASKVPAVNIDYLAITDNEIKAVRSIKGKQTQRLAFTLLCLAKYWDAETGKDEHWVNSKDSEIMQMANINTSVKRQSAMYYDLNALGLVQFSKRVDNTNVRVCFIKPGKTVLKISDFRNLGYQYLKYNGEPLYECENCGIVSKIPKTEAGRKPKYCRSCATKIKIMQSVNSVMRTRGLTPKHAQTGADNPV